jgi:NAD+ diphosphatase
MIGAISQAASVQAETIRLDIDPELETAKWFDLDEVKEALRVGTSGLGEDASEEYVEGNLRLPPRSAIANQLIATVVHGDLSKL